jgi:hypothetical protein
LVLDFSPPKINNMSKIRDKDIQFLLDLEIPSDSELSFCGSDDDMDHEDAIIIGPKEEDQILKEIKEMEDFQRNMMTELEKVDECIAINDISVIIIIIIINKLLNVFYFNFYVY